MNGAAAREAATVLAAVMLGASAVLGFVRLALGPSLPDRVVALDLLAAVVVGAIVLFAVAVEQPVYLDAAIVAALMTFLGTVACARYIEKGSIH